VIFLGVPLVADSVYFTVVFAAKASPAVIVPLCLGAGVVGGAWAGARGASSGRAAVAGVETAVACIALLLALFLLFLVVAASSGASG
jgi:hypothetical protein